MPRLIGFAWEEAKAKQVVWGTPNGNLGEDSVAVGGGWDVTALNAVANAPKTSLNDITAFSWTAGKSKQICYTTDDHHVHEINQVLGGGWHHTDLTQLTGAPPCLSGVLSGYDWKKGGKKQIAYVGPDNHIHELFVAANGSWAHADLTAIAGAPPVASGRKICGYSWEKAATKQVVYSTADGHIHELWVGLGQSWKHADLTALSGAPPMSGSYAVGFAWEEASTKQVVYPTANGHLHELWVGLGQSWKHADLTQLAGAVTTLPTGTSFAAYAWPDGKTKQVAYLGSGGHVHEFYVGLGGSWQYADLTAIAGGPDPDVSGYFAGYAWDAGNSKQVVYTTDDGHIHELYVAVGKSWKHAILPGLTH